MEIIGIKIDDWVKIFQCVFYISIATITVFTYLKAKRGLLSTVNTEYHKRVIDRLDELSKTLLDEYDYDSPNHWSKKNAVEDAVDEINKRFLKHKDQILRTGEFPSGLPSNADYERLSSLVQRVKSDPFIPKQIREKVIDLLENRAHVIIGVHLKHLEKYRNSLAKGNNLSDLDENKYVIYNRVLDDLNDRGCGISQIEEEVHKIRQEIQNYFDKFFPK